MLQFRTQLFHAANQRNCFIFEISLDPDDLDNVNVYLHRNNAPSGWRT